MSIMDYLRLKLGFRYYTTTQLRHYQFKTIQRNFALAQAKAPYYQHLPIQGIKTWEDFYQLPMMDKTLLMERFDEFNTVGIKRDDVEAYALAKESAKDYTGYYLDQYVVGLSSGTSGNKGIYLTDKALTKKLPWVFLARSGIALKYLPFRILFCLRVFSQGFADINSPLITINYRSTMTPVLEVINLINHSKINILMAPPSFIRQLLPYINQINQPLSCIVCYAEVLTPQEKDKFKTLFHTQVIEIYQASEGQIASACSCGNLHLNEDLVFAELYDRHGQPVTKAGIPGQLVVTNLVNTVQPLFRYRMNDWVVLKDGCPCGSNYRVLDYIIGRNDDVVVFTTPDGQPLPVFPDLISRWIITYSNLIREFKVIQPTINQLNLMIDCATSHLDDKFINNLHDHLMQHFQEFQLVPTLTITLATITLPSDNTKYKRFEVVKDSPVNNQAN